MTILRPVASNGYRQAQTQKYKSAKAPKRAILTVLASSARRVSCIDPEAMLAEPRQDARQIAGGQGQLDVATRLAGLISEQAESLRYLTKTEEAHLRGDGACLFYFRG